ncbi:heme/hemin ABC transporter substrate-binding protein [Microbacterium album]|uniref:ABC transporter substrate-binding protein n=1 Tax=Microbacterium album TaxID=2053191 RepID=A0A917MNI4_9MICO|nr:ABC transporter substrate-binding protein [Microbacterium album]GGH51364.1 ABC transporter substrate-binding protein [Microbacterium album]
MPASARRRTRMVAATAVLLMFALTGCEALLSHADAGRAVTPPLAEVTPLDDPRAWQGPSTAVAAPASADPVTDGEQRLPVTLVDTQGTEVTVTDADRILALDIYGSLSRIVYELGLGDQLVGRDISSTFPEIADLPLVTQNGHDLNAEAMLELHPTVILTDTSLGPWDTILQMREVGIPVVIVEPKRTIESIGSLIGEVAEALGVPQRGEILSQRVTGEVAAKIAQISEIAPADPADRLRMMFLYVRGQSGVYYLFGEESGADTLIEALGGNDIAGEIGWTGMRPVTAEALAAADPELILMMTKGLESVGGVEGLVDHIPAIAQTTAGRNQRIVDMSDSTILSFGPDTASVLDALAVAIYAPEEAGR